MNFSREQYQQAVFLCNCVYGKCDSSPQPKSCINTKSGLRANVYEFDSVDYIVFCGTNQLRDWITNFKMLLGLTPKQFKEALDFINKEFRHKKTIVCSHSLGGAIAQYCVVHISRDNVLCLNFNPAGVRHMLKPKKYKLYEDNIWNIVTYRDILYRLTAVLPFNWMKNIGKTIIIQDDDSWNGIKSHSAWEVFYDAGGKLK